MPLPKPRADSVAAAGALAADTTPLDSAWLRTFHDTMGGPLRFGVPRRAAPSTQQPAAQPTTQPAPQRAAAPISVTPGVAPRMDSAALSIFNTEEAGPLRFQRAIEGDTVKPRPRPQRPRGPRLLGVPYNPSSTRQ